MKISQIKSPQADRKVKSNRAKKICTMFQCKNTSLRRINSVSNNSPSDPMYSLSIPSSLKRNQQLKDQDASDCRVVEDEFDPIECSAFFQRQATEAIQGAYDLDKCLRRTSSEGALITSLPEDVFSLLHTFLIVLDECFLSRFAKKEKSSKTYKRKISLASKTKVTLLTGTESIQPVTVSGTLALHSYFIDGLLHVIRTIRENHCSISWLFAANCLEDTCAAANDFFRMSEKMDHFVTETLLKKYEFHGMHDSDLDEKFKVLIHECSDLTSLLLNDSVQASEKCVNYIMQTVQNDTTLCNDFFSTKWEVEYSANEVALGLVDVFHENLHNIKRYLAYDFLFHKLLVVCAKAMVSFYIYCLILKAEAIIHAKNKRFGFLGKFKLNAEPFHSQRRALMRMKDDIVIMTQFFRDIAMSRDVTCNYSALSRIIANDMWILEVIHEYLQTAMNSNDNDLSLESFILVIHKRTGANTLVTKCFISDLWLLSSSQSHQRSSVFDTVKYIQPDLRMVTKHMKGPHQMISPVGQEQKKVNNIPTNMVDAISYDHLDEMMKNLYEDRIAQGLLPVCWPCSPQDQSSDVAKSRKLMDLKLSKQIENVTKLMTEFPRQIIESPMMKNNKKERQ